MRFLPLLCLSISGIGAYANAAPALNSETLTPIGATRAGNGTDIPEWKGGIKVPPKQYKRGGPLVMPASMKRDRPTFVVTQANHKQHAAVLSEGHKQLFRTYSSYKMPVYQTRRTAAYPERIYRWTALNAKRATLTGDHSIAGAAIGFPFPLPLPTDEKSSGNVAAKIMWNHTLRYRGNTLTRANDKAIVLPSGSVHLTKALEITLYYYANTKKGKAYARGKSRNRLFKRRTMLTAPGRVSGQNMIVHEFVDQAKQRRVVWVAMKGDTKLKLEPRAGFDNPTYGSRGMQFDDQVGMYNGSFERYNWTFKGVKEMLMPHNAYKGVDHQLKYEEMLPAHHYNQDLARYEKHRVWVVEATLREGQQHSFSKRVFYVNEDCWCVVMVDNYDENGTLYRFQEAHLVNYYSALTVSGAPELIYDFRTNNYFATALANEGKPTVLNRKVRESELYTSGSCGERYHVREPVKALVEGGQPADQSVGQSVDKQ